MPSEEIPSDVRLRILVLWTTASGYMRASLRALADRAEVVVVWKVSGVNAPYSPVANEPFIELDVTTDGGVKKLRRLDRTFKPDIVVVCGWHISEYQAVADATSAGAKVLFFDNPWTGSFRQRIGIVARARSLRARYSGVLVPGPRQARFARRMGFGNSQIRTGGYTADVDSLAPPEATELAVTKPQRKFVFVGRLVVEKGFGELLDAYRQYRAATTKPWPLHVFGTGPLQEDLARHAGVVHHGFVQPNQLQTMWAQEDCLVLPSHEEHWGVVVHEATSAGLSVICTTVVGAVPSLVEHGANGLLVAKSDVSGLTSALLKWADGRQDYSSASRISRGLASRFSPQLWSETLLAFSRAV